MIISKNPYNAEEFARHEEDNASAIDQKLQNAEDTFQSWKKVSFKQRAFLMGKAAEDLISNKEEYAGLMTREMGKPVSQAVAEVEKCSWVCRYYAEKAESQLAPEQISTDAEKSFITYEPLGCILAIMPWNYPLWQVFRFAAPAIMAGNTVLLKHASNVMGSAGNIEKVFKRAGFPEGCFTKLIVKSEAVADIIKDSRIKAVTLTGSTAAGSAVASEAAANIKKSVLELGGSNALIVFEDANLQETVKVCVQARFQNTGQSCIAGKRLLLHESIASEFTAEFKKQVSELKSGDPMDKDTFTGVLAREDLAETVEEQVRESVEAGAEIILGGKRKGAYFEPTILTGVSPEMRIFKEEVFGPAIGIMTFKSDKEAVALANSSGYGLGVSIFTDDPKRAEELVPEFEDGAVFVNALVKSDPRLPFGGTKDSGFGRELSYHGIREFVNVKTVYHHKF
ncbi:MAG TPA: NAD-dependent succinate-semialdehyde dehydrogenase [Salinimicrobium sp.]|nr:NAD-dependent succinate-semialdehyde dehydrogenase [Salinimicrobium sp.]